jgi:hypothetical protein
MSDGVASSLQRAKDLDSASALDRSNDSVTLLLL